MDLTRKPIVGASLGYTRTNHVTEFSVPQPGGTRLVVYPDIPDNVASRLAFQWPIYTAGRIDALERAAIAEADAAGADIETTRADLRLEIVRAYWAAATAREAVRVLEEAGARAEAQVLDARNRFEVGLIPPNEVSSLEAQRSRERAQLIEASNLRESALIELRRLIGAPPDQVDRACRLSRCIRCLGASGAKGEVPELVKQALETRSERKALNLRLDSVEARKEAALTANKPTIAFAGGVDYSKPNAAHFSDDQGVAGVVGRRRGVNWNFFDSGRAKSQAAEAEAAATATRERLAEFDSIVSADVRQRLLDLDSNQAMVRASADAVQKRRRSETRGVATGSMPASPPAPTCWWRRSRCSRSELARTRALAGVRLAEARLERVLGRRP